MKQQDVRNELRQKAVLIPTDKGLTLSDGCLSLTENFVELLPRIRRENLGGELLVRAVVGKKDASKLHVIDATAGLGEDSFLLAAAGCSVDLFEYNPTIFALLEDACRRALATPELSLIASRMNCHLGDSVDELPRHSFADEVDVILLDPMFPERQKSGKIKKKFQLLHELELPCDKEEELLRSAMQAHPLKIVIKRPVNAPVLGGVKPSYSLGRTTIRYDCIVDENRFRGNDD